MAVGYIAAFSETLALAVIVSKGVAPLKDVSGVAGENQASIVYTELYFFIHRRTDCQPVRLNNGTFVVVFLESSSRVVALFASEVCLTS